MGHAVAFESTCTGTSARPKSGYGRNAPDRQRFEKTWGHGRSGPFWLLLLLDDAVCRASCQPSAVRRFLARGEDAEIRWEAADPQPTISESPTEDARLKPKAPKRPHRCTSWRGRFVGQVQGRSTTSNSSRSAPVATGLCPSVTGPWSAAGAWPARHQRDSWLAQIVITKYRSSPLTGRSKVKPSNAVRRRPCAPVQQSDLPIQCPGLPERAGH